MHLMRPLAGAATVAFALCTSLTLPQGPDRAGRTAFLSVASASAQTVGTTRRVARRTARRTTQRNETINALPAGCVRRNAYWFCGGIYYQPVVQSGRTVYVVVNL